jgi:hypothetical protein
MAMAERFSSPSPAFDCFNFADYIGKNSGLKPCVQTRLLNRLKN